MAEQKVMNRWFVVIGAVLIQLCLGAIYAWSVFTPKLTLPAADGGNYAFSASQAAWVFSIGLLVFSVVMIISGRMITKIGPRKLAVLGGIVLGAGYILGGLFGSTFAAQLIFIGIIGGAGIGFAYVVPIAVGVKWFPDKKGMVTGLAVAGFGFGATIWVKSAGSWFDLLNSLNYFGLGGVQSVFFLYGIIFLVAVLLGSIVMIDPPAGFIPKGWTPPAATAANAHGAGLTDFQPREMLKTLPFYLSWFTFLFSAIAGLMVIYCIKLFGIDALKASGATVAIASATAGTAMAWYAIFNGLGRIVWGTVSDKIGRKMAIFLMCLFQGIIMLFFYKMGGIGIGLIIGACIIGFNFGGNFALFPAITADYFGNKNVGLNYGYIFVSYGIAGIIGPQIAGFFKDAAKGGSDPSIWITPFIIAGVACLAGALITLISKAPKKA
ncbi:MAG TPA: OFA family MFS transporter [Desulfobacteraceae bacterium]|nr:OFA family MFS transporter [Desulfobacteraceae bacterium]HPJ67454.1 OFA family MFS transporter [Desulfobacteraceae bacterium]HPQ27509.1 OFA family MFS transporter [Desulfobacteraceae bacterium]